MRKMLLVVVLAGIALAGGGVSGCAKQPVITKEIYQDRSMWVRLEKYPYPEPPYPETRPEEETSLSPGQLAAWLKGFRVLTDRGIMGMATGKGATEPAFVEQEILTLTPHLAKALAAAKPDEQVGYCFTADRSLNERYITTAAIYVRKPYIYYKLNEWRSLIKVSSLSTPTSEACQTKPQPGYKTEDRYFRLEYEPEEFVVGATGFLAKYASFMAATIQNGRGEVVFRLSSFGRPKTAQKVEPPPTEAPSAPQPAAPPLVANAPAAPVESRQTVISAPPAPLPAQVPMVAKESPAPAVASSDSSMPAKKKKKRASQQDSKPPAKPLPAAP